MKTKIDIDTSPFVRSHGRAPSGRGSWAFAIDGSGLPLIWTPSMTLSDAKVWVKAAVRSMIADGTIPADLPCIDLSVQP